MAPNLLHLILAFFYDLAVVPNLGGVAVRGSSDGVDEVLLFCSEWRRNLFSCCSFGGESSFAANRRRKALLNGETGLDHA